MSKGAKVSWKDSMYTLCSLVLCRTAFSYYLFPFFSCHIDFVQPLVFCDIKFVLKSFLFFIFFFFLSLSFQPQLASFLWSKIFNLCTIQKKDTCKKILSEWSFIFRVCGSKCAKCDELLWYSARMNVFVRLKFCFHPKNWGFPPRDQFDTRTHLLNETVYFCLQILCLVWPQANTCQLTEEGD